MKFSTANFNFVIICFTLFSSCTKDDTVDNPTTIDFTKPVKIGVGGSQSNIYNLFYNQSNLVNKIVKTPGVIGASNTYTILDVDSIFMYYNPNNTISRIVHKSEYRGAYNGNSILRTAYFYEYAGNKLVKIYKKNSKHTDPVDVYDPVYEQQLGPIAYGNVNDIDSIAYNSRGMISEIYKWYLNFSLGVVTRMPYVNHYTKFTYMPSNDSLINKIEVMPFVNAPITDPNYNVVNLAEYDLSIKNPLYASIYNFSFPFYYIDMLPVNTSTGYVDIYMSLSPYLLKQFSAKSLGAYGPQVITYTTTNQKDIANRLITCSSGFSTWGTAGGFSFVF